MTGKPGPPGAPRKTGVRRPDEGEGPGQVLDPTELGTMNNMLAAVVSSGTGKRAQLGAYLLNEKGFTAYVLER